MKHYIVKILVKFIIVTSILACFCSAFYAVYRWALNTANYYQSP